ncbi:MAG: hypothetical protein Q4F21_12145 [Lachnospiraceae bacterium]|nr:hypothetical protein [Lachnospiraceae bacterium]
MAVQGFLDRVGVQGTQACGDTGLTGAKVVLRTNTPLADLYHRRLAGFCGFLLSWNAEQLWGGLLLEFLGL